MTPETPTPSNFHPAETVTAEKRLAVTEREAIAMLGLDKLNASERAQKRNFKKLRDKKKIETLPGFVFSVKQLERAMQ